MAKKPKEVAQFEPEPNPPPGAVIKVKIQNCSTQLQQVQNRVNALQTELNQVTDTGKQLVGAIKILQETLKEVEGGD